MHSNRDSRLSVGSLRGSPAALASIVHGVPQLGRYLPCGAASFFSFVAGWPQVEFCRVRRQVLFGLEDSSRSLRRTGQRSKQGVQSTRTFSVKRDSNLQGREFDQSRGRGAFRGLIRPRSFCGCGYWQGRVIDRSRSRLRRTCLSRGGLGVGARGVLAALRGRLVGRRRSWTR